MSGTKSLFFHDLDWSWNFEDSAEVGLSRCFGGHQFRWNCTALSKGVQGGRMQVDMCFSSFSVFESGPAGHVQECQWPGKRVRVVRSTEFLKLVVELLFKLEPGFG